MSKKKRVTKKTSKKDDEKLFAFLATFFIIVGFLLAIWLRKDNKYIMFYAKQGLVVFIGFVIASIFSWIPPIGWALPFFVFVLWIISFINALSGEKRNTFLVGEIAEKIKI